MHQAHGSVTQADRLVAGAALLPRVSRALDVGCGDGSLSMLLQGKVGHLVGIDRTMAACRESRAKGISVQCVDFNAPHLPYRDHSFEAISCLDVIEHVLDPVKLLHELARILQPQGVLVVTTPNIRYYGFVLTLIRGRFPRTSGDAQGYDGGHLHYFTFSDLRRLLADTGFGLIEEFGLYQWTALTPWGRLKETVKAVFGDRLKREFFSGAVVVKAVRNRGARP